MKRHDLIRMILVAASYLAFLPLAFFLYNGRNGIYYDAYEKSVKLFDSMSVQQTILFAIIFGLGASVLIQIGVYFFTPEGKSEKRCVLFSLPMSQALCAPYLLSYLLSLLFALLLSHGKIGTAAVIVTYLLLLLLQLALLLLPSPKLTEIPDPITDSAAADDALTRYSGYLRKLTEKSESPALSSAMIELAGLLDTVDPTLSDGVEALESKLGAECIEIENAILGGSGAKITLLTRELIDLSEGIRTRISAASLTVRGQTFEETDNEIAEGLIDKILDEMNVEDEADIINRSTPLDTDLRFMKALRFADEEYRGILEGYNQTIRKRLKKEQADEKARLSRIRKTFRKITYVSFGILGIVMMASLMIRAFVTQPGGFLYGKNDDGSLTIRGYNQQYGETVEIPAAIHGKPVSAIGKRAFKNQLGVSRIVVPEGVKIIEIDCFSDAGNLRTIYLPASLTNIYGFAFYKDKYLTIHYASDEETWNKILERSGNMDTIKSSELIFNSAPEE